MLRQKVASKANLGYIAKLCLTHTIPYKKRKPQEEKCSGKVKRAVIIYIYKYLMNSHF
jgi:hypothetical protein